MDKKRRHHFVWRKYLEAWATDGRIWCCMNGTIFPASLTNVALRRDFYKVTELRSEEVDLIRRLFIEPTVPVLQDLHNGWIEAFHAGFELRKWLEDKDLLKPEIERQIEIAIHNAEEELHARIEANAIPLLDSIRNGDISFYSSEQGCMNFGFYLSEQYVRTPNIKSRVLSNVTALQPNVSFLQSIDFERLWNVLSHILATNIARELYQKSDSMRMVLLNRQGAKEFITGDQPVINTFGVGLPTSQAPEALEFYYPVSAQRAILITNSSGDDTPRSLSDSEVDRFNRMIVDQSDTQIYGASEDALSEYCA